MNSRYLAPALAALLSFGGCGSSQLPVPAPPAPEEAVAAGVDRILELSDIERVLQPRARALTRAVAISVQDPTDEELERLVPAVLEAFDYEALRARVADYMVEQATPELVEQALEWMEAGATAAVRRIGEDYDPPLSLEEYANEYTEDPPSEARIHLFADWADAMGEAEFFVLLQEALREATYRVHGTLRDNAPDFEPMGEDQLAVTIDASHAAAVIRLLHAYQPAPEHLVRRSTAEYRSESGQWFVDTYTFAVANAIREAGREAAEALSGSS